MADESPALEGLLKEPRALPEWGDDEVRELGDLLVLSPHPDDETLGCAGLMARALALGKRVRVCLMTDGAGSHPLEPELMPQQVAEIRQGELRTALGFLGSNGATVELEALGVEDGTLPLAGEQGFEELIGRVALLLDHASTVLFPYRDEFHRDHQATARLGLEAIQRSQWQGRVLEFPVWAWEGRIEGAFPSASGWMGSRLPLEGFAAQKRDAIQAHASQVDSGVVEGVTRGPALKREFVRHFMGPEEVFLEARCP